MQEVCDCNTVVFACLFVLVAVQKVCYWCFDFVSFLVCFSYLIVSQLSVFVNKNEGFFKEKMYRKGISFLVDFNNYSV